MRRIALLLVVLVLAGCAARQQAAVEPEPAGPVLYYELEIPKAFQDDVRGWSSGMSGCQRHMQGFKMGWWRCIDNYRRDIGYQSSQSDYIVSGRGEFIGGFDNGYRNAEEQIQRNIKTFGPDRTHAYLLDITANVMAE